MAMATIQPTCAPANLAYLPTTLTMLGRQLGDIDTPQEFSAWAGAWRDARAEINERSPVLRALTTAGVARLREITAAQTAMEAAHG